MFIRKEKNTLFIANTSNSVSLKLKLPVLGQNLEVNSCLRHQNIFSSLNGVEGSKAVEKALLEVSAKIGETKSTQEARIFNAMGFDCKIFAFTKLC